MPRPRGFRKIRFNPTVTYFKPQGVPLRFLESVELREEELEAIRLRNLKALSQEEIALKMKTSQSTVQRILTEAYKKISDALINGKSIIISNK